MKPQEHHQLAAIVFTDIVNYTKTMDSSEELAISFLDRQRKIFFPIIESYNGKVIKEMRDGLLIMFDSAIQAVRCTNDFLTKLNEEKFSVRAGIHIGDVMFKDGDVFGSAVNIAARIEPLASPNRMCVSEDVRSQIRNKTDFSLVSKGK